MWIGSQIDTDAMIRALGRADHGPLLAWMALFTILVFVADAACLHLLFRRLLGRFSFSEVLAVKGVSYFLNAVNYSAGTGSIAYFVHRRGDQPFLRALSALLWLNFVDIAALLILLSLGMLLGGELLPEGIAERLPWVVGVGSAIVIGALLYWRRGWDFFILGRLRGLSVFAAFQDAKMSDYMTLLGARTGFIGLYVLMTWALLPTFQIPVPLMALMVYVPLLTFVQIVPASISGLGAIQWVMIALYAPHLASAVGQTEAEATVVAFSTVVGPGVTLMRLGLGYLLLGRIAPDLLVSKEDLEAAREAEGDRAPDQEAGGVSSSEGSSGDSSEGSSEDSPSEGSDSGAP